MQDFAIQPDKTTWAEFFSFLQEYIPTLDSFDDPDALLHQYLPKSWLSSRHLICYFKTVGVQSAYAESSCSCIRAPIGYRFYLDVRLSHAHPLGKGAFGHDPYDLKNGFKDLSESTFTIVVDFRKAGSFHSTPDVYFAGEKTSVNEMVNEPITKTILRYVDTVIRPAVDACVFDRARFVQGSIFKLTEGRFQNLMSSVQVIKDICGTSQMLNLSDEATLRILADETAETKGESLFSQDYVSWHDCKPAYINIQSTKNTEETIDYERNQIDE